MKRKFRQLNNYKRFGTIFRIKKAVYGQTYEELTASPMFDGFMTTLISMHALGTARDALKKAGLLHG